MSFICNARSSLKSFRLNFPENTSCKMEKQSLTKIFGQKCENAFAAAFSKTISNCVG